MGMWDNLAERQFASDESGRLVFLPRGPRRPAYFIDSNDESKIKSLVKVYVVAAALINLAGSTASIAITQAMMFDERTAPLADKLKFGLVIYAISATLFYIGPSLLLWNIYRGVLDGLCSSLTTVDPASLHLVRACPSSRRTLLILLGAGVLLLGIAVVAAISYRPC